MEREEGTMHIDDDDRDDSRVLLPPVPANDNAAYDMDPLDARLLGHVLELLHSNREHGVAASIVFDALSLREPNVEPGCIREALRDARRSGFVVLRDKRLYLARAVSEAQVRCVRTLIAAVCARGRK
jgi:hypothetical protein